ncbi:chymotrypsin-like protease CTRL-1 [Xenopus laevis]|uniref:Chymotrypsin-like protease CTRL-1 n=1 Tax=Xenopus laevis TaxID=8355 RepID=A0A8J1LWA6_XENLA|nr:chymotrypsin-like protease CTRL-1 [Xenopus laevis]OCT59123.1 hypothetical protein XELAEV_18001612mg [Xenopus laevis]
MKSFHLIQSLLLLNLGIFGFAEEDHEPTCGMPKMVSSRIAGGQDAKKGENPWQVMLWLPGRRHCGGSLISSNFVVTVAHCFNGTYNPSSVIAILGAYKITGNLKEENDVPVKAIYVHPSYNATDLSNNIALVELSQSVAFTDVILPVCLSATSTQFTPGHSCIVSGWGDLEFNSTKPKPVILQEVEMRLISIEQCRSYYDKGHIGHIIKDGMICAMDMQGIRSPCMGDGGGPLVCYEREQWYLVGIVIFGFGCGFGHPSVYTFVPAYKNWIEKYVASSASGSIALTPWVTLDFMNTLPVVQSLSWLILRNPLLSLMLSAATWLQW